jgi:RNA-directed DNA polymerase
MMHGAKKSDPLILPTKSANNAGQPTAESMEGSGGIKRSANLQSTVRAQSREAVSQAQARIHEIAKKHKGERLTALLHHVTVDVLRWSFLRLKKDSAPGIDGVTWEQYAATDLEGNLQDLHRRVHTGAYRALPSRRKFIPKADGTQRPLGIAALEDKIVQMAIVVVLNPIYESDFLGFSYGFRPKRSQHDALDALAWAIKAKKVCWILDADISRFFDTIDHRLMIRFIEHRIGDRRIIRLIQKWLKAGVIDGDQIVTSSEGTPQGAVISPLLSNAFLHYVYDLWANQWRKRHSRGDMVIIRYADDTIVGFQYYDEAKRFLSDLKHRLESFGLSLHPKKTRLLEFGKYAAERRRTRGLGKPETFDFLGFTHICGTKESRAGFQLRRKTPRKRMQAKLQEIKAELRRHVHASIDEQGRWLAGVVRGFFAYYAVPTNSAALCTFVARIRVIWIRRIRRRSQRHRMTWARMRLHFDRHLPRAKVIHPWPEERFRVRYSR